MKIKFIPISLPTGARQKTYTTTNGYVILHRKGEKPRVILNHAKSINGDPYSNASSNPITRLRISGDFVNDFSFLELQENDTLFYPASHNAIACVADVYPKEDILLPFDLEPTVLNIAYGLEKNCNVFICTNDTDGILDRAIRIHEQAAVLYWNYPAYEHIMMKENGETKVYSLVHLASLQDIKTQEMLASMFLTLRDYKATNLDVSTAIANRVLENISFTEHFQLLTQEEQVGSFIEFSRLSSESKLEYVTDEMIETIKASDEYARILELFEVNDLGLSETQQFNVFQQVGYLSSDRQSGNIMYNLSDMGAGKTLMTVEAICLLDLKLIKMWNKNKDHYITEGISVDNVFLPDKHIIAPTLSIKSSWINTFKLFYDVEEIDDMTYTLSITYDGITAKSKIYVASFTIKNSQMHVKSKLPQAEKNTYLIVDEIHQLVGRNISKTKFFPPKTNPSEIYKTFILSGTMSNLKTSQWYNYLRFMGLPITDNTPQEAVKNVDTERENYMTAIVDATKDIRSAQHRQFDCDDFSKDNTYRITGKEKMSGVEQEFFTKYGTQIITTPMFYEDETYSVEELLSSGKRKISLCVDQSETDATNFQLFYDLVGSHAITAQSTQVAEELFGDQKQQHVSDIIKTVSPLSDDDIAILKTLHHIAAAHNQYKSVSIAKTINTAILNLNDGLQTKNIYEIISRFADRNIRFFEYLTTLDVNILEQLPKSGLINMPKLEDTDKFKVLQDILRREKDETHLIVVNDFYALKSLSTALGINYITKQQLAKELDYQETLDDLFAQQSIVVVTQDMIKSSLDLVQANRLIQYQLNTEISDIIQTQNRINRIGQTRETRGYYIASDALQENLIELFLTSYRNIRVAHKGIVELFVDITSQINIVNDYLAKAINALEDDTLTVDDSEDVEDTEMTNVDTVGVEDENIVDEKDNEAKPVEDAENCTHIDDTQVMSDVIGITPVPSGSQIVSEDSIAKAILYPQNGMVYVMVSLDNGKAFPIGTLSERMITKLNVISPKQASLNVETYTIV